MKPSGPEKKRNISVNFDHCDIICENNNLMDAHLSETHNSNPDKDLVVEDVDEVFNGGNVEGFVKLKSSKEFKCDQCASKFKKKNTLQKHINAKHLKQEKFWQCKSCFVSKKELQNHIKERHRKGNDNKQYDAEVSEASDHEYDSDLENLEPVTCMECPEQFNDWSDLSDHLKHVHKLWK